jgi:alpha/beta superfamily hydrolase
VTAAREHETEAAVDTQAVRRTPEQAGWVSPAAQCHAEQVARDRAPQPVPEFVLPDTREQLLDMPFGDRCRVWTEDRTRYDRLMATS